MNVALLLSTRRRGRYGAHLHGEDSGSVDRRHDVRGPVRQREGQLPRDRGRLARSVGRLLTAYQEGLVSLEQLRCRMPEPRRQEQTIQGELQSLGVAATDQSRYLGLVETLADFRTRLSAHAAKRSSPGGTR